MRRTIKLLPLFILALTVIGLFGCGEKEPPTPQLSDEKELLSFKINGVEGTITFPNTVNFLFPKGTDISNLAPQIVISDKATITPASGVAQHFTGSDDVRYKVTAEDGSTSTYSVRVRIDVPTYKIGDLYPDPDDPSSAIGVVFYVNGSTYPQHGKIVSLDETGGIAWSTENVITGSKSQSDGKENTDNIRANMDLNKYPAFKWCIDKGEGWYLPAYEELMILRALKGLVDGTIKDIGGAELWPWPLDFYWESGEGEATMASGVSATGVIMTSKARTGSILGSFEVPYVRAVRAF